MTDENSGFNYNWLWLIFAVLLLARVCEDERYCEIVDDGFGGRYLCEP